LLSHPLDSSDTTHEHIRSNGSDTYRVRATSAPDNEGYYMSQQRHLLVVKDLGTILVQEGPGHKHRRGPRLYLREALIDHDVARNLADNAVEDGLRLGPLDDGPGAYLESALNVFVEQPVAFVEG